MYIYKAIIVIGTVLLVGCSSQQPLQKIDNVPDDVTSVKAITPIFGQKVAFNLPTTWKPAFQDQKESSFIIEFVPKNESIQSWNNIISVQGFKNRPSNVSAESVLDKLANGFKSACGEFLVYEKLGESDVDDYNSYNAILGCREIPTDPAAGITQAQSEIGYYYAIEGEEDLYIIHKTKRGDAFAEGNSPLNSANSAAFIEPITPIELCVRDGLEGQCNK